MAAFLGTPGSTQGGPSAARVSLSLAMLGCRAPNNGARPVQAVQDGNDRTVPQYRSHRESRLSLAVVCQEIYQL